MKTTFIYILIDPTNNHVRYVGKTNNPIQRHKGHIKERHSIHNTYKVNWIKSLDKKGLFPILETIDEVPLIEWEFWEMHYISLYKSFGFKLTNGTFGGDGGPSGSFHYLYGKYGKDSPVYGRTHTEETKLSMSVNQKGENNSFYNKKHNLKSLEKISKAAEGKNNPNFGGKFHTNEYLNKQIASNSKKPFKVTDKETNETNEFKNSRDAGLFYNLSPGIFRGKKPRVIYKRYLLEFI